ncbi:MAG: RNA 2',3'-cyclic phosphodiesterase [Gaiellaceae bacterium]
MADERLRLFCALQLPGDAIQVLVRWQVRHLSAGRIVPPEHLHVTLAFLGSRPAADVPAIVRELTAASAAAAPVRLRGGRYRETRSVGMVVLDDVDGAATAVAADLAERLEHIGAYRREQRPWLPHVTVLRFRERPRLAPPAADLGELRVVRSALYRSALGPAGARYDVLESLPLGGVGGR